MFKLLLYFNIILFIYNYLWYSSPFISKLKFKINIIEYVYISNDEAILFENNDEAIKLSNNKKALNLNNINKK